MQFEPEMITAPLVLFFTVVLPIWIVFHYITVWKRDRHSRRSDKTSYKDLQDLAVKLEDRLDAVESILDTDAPAWRKSQ